MTALAHEAHLFIAEIWEKGRVRLPTPPGEPRHREYWSKPTHERWLIPIYARFLSPREDRDQIAVFDDPWNEPVAIAGIIRVGDPLHTVVVGTAWDAIKFKPDDELWLLAKRGGFGRWHERLRWDCPTDMDPADPLEYSDVPPYWKQKT